MTIWIMKLGVEVLARALLILASLLLLFGFALSGCISIERLFSFFLFFLLVFPPFPVHEVAE